MIFAAILEGLKWAFAAALGTEDYFLDTSHGFV